MALVILFGTLCSFFTGPGQTYFISLFNPDMQKALNLSHSEISLYYAVATITSALMLPFLGRTLDKFDSSIIAVFCSFGLALACFIMSGLQSVFLLFLGYFFLRFMGQGGFSLLSRATISRSFHTNRGKALSICSLGYPAAEAVFPLMIVTCIGFYGWRSTWFFFSLFMLFFASPALFFLSRKISQKSESIEKPVKQLSQWSLRDVLLDFRFHLLALPSVFAPLLVTALFFHQSVIVEAKSWNMETVAAAFITFAVGRAAASVLIGPLIDRFSAKKLVFFHLFPLFFAVAILIFFENSIFAYFYLALAGITVGIGSNVKTAMWAELYGTKNIASIQSLMSSLMVVSTALGPLIYGYCLDAHLSIRTILIFSLIFGFCINLLILPALYFKNASD